MLAYAAPILGQPRADHEHVDAQPLAGAEIREPPPGAILKPRAVFQADGPGRDLEQALGRLPVTPLTALRRVDAVQPHSGTVGQGESAAVGDAGNRVRWAFGA